MARVVVDVMLKPEILDPQGKAVHGALPRLGFDGVIDVRQGKRFELEFEGDVTEERLAEVRRAAETLLSNPVIEDYTVKVELVKIGVVTFPGSLDDVDAQRAARVAGAEPVALWHGDHDLRGVDAVVLPGWLLLRRLPALRRHRSLRAGDGRGRRGGQGRDARARHLQRLPDPVRVAPAARRPDPQRPPQVRLPRPAAPDRERVDRVDQRLRGRRRGDDRAQERRGRVRRRRRHARPPRR